MVMMNEKTNYSFIIPHHNSPLLLNRCLDSIPQREDIEIIVVDDNSDVDKKPQISRPDVKPIFIDAEHTKGAGRARNYGLKEVKGKWVVFADADDFFTDGFLDVLDKYKDSDLDVVYHPANAADTVSLREMPNLLKKQNEYFANYDGTKETEDCIRFRIHSPWWKFVRRKFLEENNIKFEEVPKGNDIFYSYQVGFFAKNIAVDMSPIYVYTYNKDGISNGKKNKHIYLNVIQTRRKSTEFYKFIGHREWISSDYLFWLRIIKNDGFVVFLQTFLAFIRSCPLSYASSMDYVRHIKERQKA